MKVQIVERLDDSSEKCITTFWVKDGVATCDNPRFFSHLMSSSGGAVTGLRGKRYLPTDAEGYLKALLHQYRGPYLFARSLEEDIAPNTGAAAPPPSGQSGTSRSSRVAAPAAEAQAPAPPPRSRKPTQQLVLDAVQLEALCGNLFRLAHALRGQTAASAQQECDTLITGLAGLMGLDRAGLLRRFADHEDVVSLRLHKPTRQSMSRIWEKIHRTWQGMLAAVEAGQIAELAPASAFIHESLGALIQIEPGDSPALILDPSPRVKPAGTTNAEHDRVWQVWGRVVLQKTPFSSALFDQLAAASGEYVDKAIRYIGEGKYTKAEAHLREALCYDPSQVDARLLLGEVLRRTDQLVAALVELNHSAEQVVVQGRLPPSPTTRTPAQARLGRAHMGIARCLLVTGYLPHAAAHLAAAAEQLDISARRGPGGGLSDIDVSRLVTEADEARVILGRISAWVPAPIPQHAPEDQGQST